ncbi:PKN2 [Cordylochernes scorpioides]|uniref:Negative elongation factor E n=1 Tax=Cordylochernes scorpioides TaxID=51811 RepID=A0ABY6KFC6_9ARAC|nr:PKN2 [Cordylochernes scorpioides]
MVVAAHEAKVDAKETAKKLLKSGAISAIKVESKERQGFKRAKGIERRRGLERMGGSMVTGYQPFSASHPADDETPTTPEGQQSKKLATVKNLYESFVGPTTREREETRTPRQGNTVYVRGFGITEEILKMGFAPYGTIMNITIEPGKNVAFVTFDKMESAEQAIKEMEGKLVSNIRLKVSMARRQPLMPNADGTSPWSGTGTIGTATKWNFQWQNYYYLPKLQIFANVLCTMCAGMVTGGPNPKSSSYNESRNMVSYEDI